MRAGFGRLRGDRGFVEPRVELIDQRTHERVGFDRGHGLGLAVHEAPRVSAPVHTALKLGAVVTVEPGLYYPGLGGCRIEDVAWLTETGHRLLSKHSYAWELG